MKLRAAVLATAAACAIAPEPPASQPARPGPARVPCVRPAVPDSLPSPDGRYVARFRPALGIGGGHRLEVWDRRDTTVALAEDVTVIDAWWMDEREDVVLVLASRYRVFGVPAGAAEIAASTECVRQHGLALRYLPFRR